jgi:hypothetical protein
MHNMNHDECIDNMIHYWTGVAVMRWYLGYQAGDIIIFEDGESYFDPPDWQVLIRNEDLIMIFLAGVLMTAPWILTRPELVICNNRDAPDMRRVRDLLTHDYRRDRLPPQDMGVISEDDAVHFYLKRVIDIMTEQFIAECCQDVQEALSENLSLSGDAIDRLLNELEANAQTML